MTTITHSQLVAKLQGMRGMAIVGMLTLTDARLSKTGNPLAMPVRKQSRVVAHVGANYEGAVNREAVRQDASPEFKSEGLAHWQEWLIPGKVIRHKTAGTLYLRTQSTPGKRKRQPVRLLCYRDAQGSFVSRQAVAPFLPAQKESTKQQAQTGMGATVWVNNYGFDSIQKIRIAGTTYRLMPDGN